MHIMYHDCLFSPIKHGWSTNCIVGSCEYLWCHLSYFEIGTTRATPMVRSWYEVTYVVYIALTPKQLCQLVNKFDQFTCTYHYIQTLFLIAPFYPLSPRQNKKGNVKFTLHSIQKTICLPLKL